MLDVSMFRGRGATYLGDTCRVICDVWFDFGELMRVSAARRCLLSGVSLIDVNLGRKRDVLTILEEGGV